ncbi:MAG: hypothetical protein HC804_13215 [Anaerolineae bacterium]|nr:hypothetical protein [Anaerolineae bacterium]
MSNSAAALPLKWPLPTEISCHAIATLPDAAQRNLQITQTYHELTIALSQLLGSENVTWCAFGTWASKTAGQFIRGDEADRMVRLYVQQTDFIERKLASLQRVLAWFEPSPALKETLVAQAIDSVPAEISRQIGAGNVKVFAELGPLFARFLADFATHTQFDQAQLDAFLVRLQPGTQEDGGQDLLRQAFTHYYHAMFAAQTQTRAEYILCANLLVGFHEQQRLQPQIVAGMEAPLENEFESNFLRQANEIIRQKAPRGIAQLIQLLWRWRLKGVSRHIADDWREISTRWIMTIVLPTETLRLGLDVPPLSDGRTFPPNLTTLQLAELTAVLATVDRTPHSTQGSAARDWGNLADRMNYITDLFRSRQQEASLYQQPFSDVQVEEIRHGRVPPGSL